MKLAYESIIVRARPFNFWRGEGWFLVSKSYLWPLTRKRTLTAFRFWTESRLQAVYQPFTKKLHPFKWLWSSIQKKLASVRTAELIRSKNLLIRSKNLLIRSNGLSHPFRKNLHPFERLPSAVQKKINNRSNGSVHRSKKSLDPFERHESSVQNISLSVRTAWVIRWAVQEKNKHDPLVRSNSSVSVQRKSSPVWTATVIRSKCQLSLKDSAGDSFFSYQRQRIYKGALVQIRVAQPVKCWRIPFVFFRGYDPVNCSNILYSITFINLSNPRFPYHSIQFNLPTGLSIKVITIVYIWSRWKNAPVAAKVII